MTTATPTVPAGTQAAGKKSSAVGRVRKRLNSRTATLVSIVIYNVNVLRKQREIR